MIWSKNKPKDYELYVKNENEILLVLERIGEVLVSCLVLICNDFNINQIDTWKIILLFAFVFMILYEIYWIKYFRSNKVMITVIILGIGHIGIYESCKRSQEC